MSSNRNWTLIAAGMLGFLGVLFAAAGSHWIEGLDEPALYRRWQAASVINLVHAAMLTALALSAGRGRAIAWAGGLITAGVLAFSGSIYFSLISGTTGQLSLAPVGGVLLLAGWIAVASAGFSPRE